MVYQLLLLLLGSLGAYAQNYTCTHDDVRNWSTFRDPDTIRVPYSLWAPGPGGPQLTWSPIRITVVFDPGDCSAGTCAHCESIGQTVTNFEGTTQACRSVDVLTPSKKTYLLNTVLAQAQAWFQNTLQVNPVMGNLVISGSSQGSTCGVSPGIVVPAAHTTTGIPNTDLVIYVSAAPARDPNSNVLAWAVACRTDGNGRPVAAQINFIPSVLTNADTQNSIQTDLDIVTAKHEATHALGFSAPFFSSRGYLGLDDAFHAGGTLTISERSHMVSKINSPRVLAEARAHFNCPTLNGLEIEDQGGSGTAGSHWEKRILVPEAMVGEISTARAYFSRMTLAFFEDTGNYRANYSQADPITWGKGKGCNFALSSCNDAAVRDLGEWCWTQNSQTQLCTQDLTAIGQCFLAQYSSALPSYEQYFANPNLGGAIDLADYCPHVVGYSNRVCIDPATTDSQNVFGATYGSSSRCFDSNLIQNGFVADSQGARCLKYSCSGTGSLLLNIQGTTVSCPSDGSAGAANLSPIQSGYQGYINCPAASTLCAQSSIPGPTPSASSSTAAPAPMPPAPPPSTTTAAPTPKPIPPAPPPPAPSSARGFDTIMAFTVALVSAIYAMVGP